MAATVWVTRLWTEALYSCTCVVSRIRNLHFPCTPLFISITVWMGCYFFILVLSSFCLRSKLRSPAYRSGQVRQLCPCYYVFCTMGNWFLSPLWEWRLWRIRRRRRRRKKRMLSSVSMIVWHSLRLSAQFLRISGFNLASELDIYSDIELCVFTWMFVLLKAP